MKKALAMWRLSGPGTLFDVAAGSGRVARQVQPCSRGPARLRHEANAYSVPPTVPT
jgi:hypothetical protein